MKLNTFTKHDKHLILLTGGMIACTLGAILVPSMNAAHVNIVSLFVNLVWLWDMEL